MFLRVCAETEHVEIDMCIFLNMSRFTMENANLTQVLLVMDGGNRVQKNHEAFIVCSSTIYRNLSCYR